MGVQYRVAHPLVQKLERVLDLTQDETTAILELPFKQRLCKRGADVAREGDLPTYCFAVLSGVVARYKILADDRRQIVSFCLAGDIPDLQSLHIERLDHSVAAISESRIAMVPLRELRRLIDDHPRIGRALWRETLIEGAIEREWMARIGRRDAFSRVAHLACELVTRLEAVGLLIDGRADFPMSQADLGDALGLTPIYINQILKQLRLRGLMAVAGRRIEIIDWDGLRQAGDFDPSYLHFPEPPPRPSRTARLDGRPRDGDRPA